MVWLWSLCRKLHSTAASLTFDENINVSFELKRSETGLLFEGKSNFHEQVLNTLSLMIKLIKMLEDVCSCGFINVLNRY